MKKRLFFATLCLLFLFTSTVPVMASSVPLYTGYTTEGIYYEVFGEIPNTTAKGTISITREVVYSGMIIPPSTLDWKETINGSTYYGQLELLRYSYSPSTQKTTAIYNGRVSN